MQKIPVVDKKRNNEHWKRETMGQEGIDATSKIITTTKHGIQILLEHLVPFVLAYEAVKGESKISGTKIEKGSPGYYSRIFSAIPHSLGTTGTLIDWYNNKEAIITEARQSNIVVAIGENTINTIYEAKTNIYNIISGNSVFQDSDLDIKLITAAIATGTLLYLIIKTIEIAEKYKKRTIQ